MIARVTTVASLGIFRATARSLVVEEVVAVDTAAAADADPWSATTATRRATCPGSAPRVAAADVVAEEEVVAIATTAVNRAICLVTAPSQDKEAAAAVVVETATTADSRVIFPGTVPSRDKGAVVVVVAADATTCNVTVAKDTATCRVNAPTEFQLEPHQAFKSAIKGSTFI